MKSDITYVGSQIEPPPFAIYKFQFDSDVPGIITEDVLLHCRASSALPVLQIVCHDLYNQVVVRDKRSRITAANYAKWGGVRGGMERFINTSVAAVVVRCEQAATPSLVNQRKDVVASLVTYQEDFSLTSTLMLEDEILENARKSGLTQYLRECLNEMASDDVRLLRSVSLTSDNREEIAYFSLGHDSLTPTLFHWREGRALVLAQEAKVRRMQWLIGAATLVIIGGILTGLHAPMLISLNQVNTLLEVVKQDTS